MPSPDPAARAARVLDLALHGLLALALLASLRALADLHPAAAIRFVSEDHGAESMSAVAWLGGAGVLLGHALVARRARRLGALALAAAAFAAGMEEIGWGQRILGLEVPELFAVHDPQAGLHAHSLFASRRTMPLAFGAVALYGVGLPLAVPRCRALDRLVRRVGLPVLDLRYAPFFAVALGLFVATREATGLLGVDEIAELFLGLGVCLALLGHVASHRRPLGPARAVGASVLGIAGTVVLAAPLVHAFDDPESLRRNLGHHASLELPEMGRLPQALAVFDYLEAHPELQRRSHPVDRARVERLAGDEAAARRTIERGLRDRAAAQAARPDDPEPPRTRGRLLRLLGREDEAAEAFATALAIDGRRLRAQGDDPGVSQIHASRARTLLAMDDLEAARRELARARASAGSRAERARLRRWLRRAEAKRALHREAAPPR